MAEEKVTYDDHIFPLFQQSCLNCHNPDKAKGGLDLSSYTGAMKGGSGGKIAEAGDTGSKLLAVILQTSEPKMPPEGDKLSDPKIAQIRAWIEGGLLENASSKAQKPSKPKFDMSLSAHPTAKPDGPPPMPRHVLLEPAVVAERPAAVQSMTTSPWAPLLAVTGQHQVLLFDTTTLDLVGILPFPEGDPVALAFTPNGRYLIVGGGIPGKSGVTVTFDISDGSRVMTAGKEFDSILACDLRPDLATVATGSPSRKIKIWNTADGSSVASIKKHTDWVTAVDFSPDGVLLATGDRNGGVWVWEAASGNEFHTLRAHQASIRTAAFRADSNVLATASEDGTVRFWEMNNGSEIKKIDAHPGGVLDFSWARDGSFATCGRDGKARLWKPDFNPLHEITELPELPVSIALDGEGQRVFIACYNGVIRVHQVSDATFLGQIDANPPTIETRLAHIRSALESQPGIVTQATQARDQRRAARNEAQTAVTSLQTRKSEAESTERETGQHHQQERAERDRLQAELSPLHHEREVRQTELADLGAQMGAHRQQLAPLAQQRDEAQAALANAELHWNEVQQSADDPEKPARIAAATASRDQCRQKSAETQSRFDASASQLATLETRHQDTNRQLGELNDRIAPLESALAEHQKTTAESQRAWEDAQAQLAPLQSSIEAAQKTLAEHEKVLAEGESELVEAQATLSHLEQDLQHWTAAEIRTRALAAARLAEESALQSDTLAESFNPLQEGFEKQLAILQKARAENLPDLPALETQLHQQEHDLILARQALAKALAETEQRRHHADQLQQNYLQALGESH
nr:c-type cytochrome domain-containing protein [Haloferula luteola]